MDTYKLARLKPGLQWSQAQANKNAGKKAAKGTFFVSKITCQVYYRVSGNGVDSSNGRDGYVVT